MKTDINDPWCETIATASSVDTPSNRFEDSFLDQDIGHQRLSDSEQYLQKLCKTLVDFKYNSYKNIIYVFYRCLLYISIYIQYGFQYWYYVIEIS